MSALKWPNIVIDLIFELHFHFFFLILYGNKNTGGPNFEHLSILCVILDIKTLSKCSLNSSFQHFIPPVVGVMCVSGIP